MESYGAVQYPQVTGPVTDPANFVSPSELEGWRGWVSQPVLPPDKRYEFESTFFLNIAAVSVPEPDPGQIAWVVEHFNPVLPIEYRYTLPSTFTPDFEQIISTPDTVDFATWVPQTSQPVLPVEYRYTLPSYFVQIEPGDFVVPPEIFVAAWARPTSQPVLPIEYRHEIPTFVFQLRPNATPPVSQPVSVVVNSASVRTKVLLQPTANSLAPIKSKNSVTAS